LPAHQVEVVRNGIDTRRFAFAGPRAGGPAVFVARLAPEKDVPTLLRATALICRQRPGFRLAIAGDGPSLPEMRRLVSDLNIADRVQFLGLVHNVPALLAEARLFVLSSISEGVPLTLLEAMASGLPVVATSVGGTPEVVNDCETGLLVPPRDPPALAAAMTRLLDDNDLARTMGEAGRRRVERHFDIRQMVATYERIYLGSGRETIMEDRHDGLDDGPDRGARGRSGACHRALAAPARD
jgi:glycosyltransferase involved in cell wall biosynthesis